MKAMCQLMIYGLYYEQRASAGLIIRRCASVSDAIGYINTAGIHTDEQVEGWKKVTKGAIKAIFIIVVDVCPS
jgi:2,4-dienoyl-CoA reductase-like NADH-dependent reductase (Old Yellow Enzyme family)